MLACSYVIIDSKLIQLNIHMLWIQLWVFSFDMFIVLSAFKYFFPFQAWEEMEARLTGPPPAADSEREKNFQKGMHSKELVIKTWTAIYAWHKLSGTDWRGFVSLSDN